MMLSILRLNRARQEDRTPIISPEDTSIVATSRRAEKRHPRPGSPATASDSTLLCGDLEEEPDLKELNAALFALAEIFPDVRPDVFREMLASLSDESRLHVVADQLVRQGAKWIRGRWRVATKVSGSQILSEVFGESPKQTENASTLLPQEETFRTTAYKNAVRRSLKDEFQEISRTAIEGVLVEQNYSYTHSRPILMSLVARSWRLSFKSLMRWKKAKPMSHFMLQRRRSSLKELGTLSLKESGSVELDEELCRTVLNPILDHETKRYERHDWELANSLNEEGAIHCGATFECQCCFDEAAFESIAFCSIGEHMLCFKCIQNTVVAALYGQAWARSIDHQRSQLACFAPASKPCTGCIPNYLTKRAILQTRGGQQMWDSLDQRFAKEAMQIQQARFVRCPFCSYAEVDDVCYPQGSPRFKPKGINSWSNLLLFFVVLFATALFCWQYFWLSFFFSMPRLRPCCKRAFELLARKRHLGLRFLCRSSRCSQASCRICRALWHDPHKCNEREELTLRIAIEAARSAAMKRVCPKCNLAFVKESGCNKMTCTCGYTMCYLCRQGLGQQPAGLTNPHQDHDYSHFCGHFRALPGRCSQCNKCDLYREENQDEIVRRAGEAAEREWRKKIGKKLVDPALDGDEEDRYSSGWEGKLQMVMDFLVDTYVTC